MTTSESIKQISGALVAFHKEVGKISKDAKNPFFKSKYASLSGILDAINEPLVNNGLTLVQFPEGENQLTTRILHVTGEWMESSYTMKPTKETPQDRGSALTYQRRYAIGAILSLNIDEDDDGNTSSGRSGQTQNSGASYHTGDTHAGEHDKANEKPWLNKGTKEYNGAIKKLGEGTTTISKIEQSYKINKEVRAEFEQIAKAANLQKA